MILGRMVAAAWTIVAVIVSVATATAQESRDYVRREAQAAINAIEAMPE